MKKEIYDYCRKKGYEINYAEYVPKGRFWCITFEKNYILDKILGGFVNYIMIDSSSILDF
jgi:hypothetical protein